VPSRATEPRGALGGSNLGPPVRVVNRRAGAPRGPAAVAEMVSSVHSVSPPSDRYQARGTPCRHRSGDCPRRRRCSCRSREAPPAVALEGLEVEAGQKVGRLVGDCWTCCRRGGRLLVPRGGGIAGDCDDEQQGTYEEPKERDEGGRPHLEAESLAPRRPERASGQCASKCLVPPGGIEPPTPGLGNVVCLSCR
jgi:hypothetical protein